MTRPAPTRRRGLREYPGGLLASLAILTALTAGLRPVAAQYVEESDTLRDHRERDEAYAERLERQRDSPFAGADLVEIRRRFLETADRLVHDRNFDAAEGRGFIVRTDDPRVAPERVAQLLDETVDWFDTYWTPLWGPPPADDGGGNGDGDDGPVPVYMFYSFAKYNQLLDGDFSRSRVRPKGHYADALGALVTHTDADSPGDLPDLMVHELAHRLAARRLGLGHDNALPWVVEGLASWVGFMRRDRDGAFVPDGIGGKHVALFDEGHPERPTDSAARLQRFKRLSRLAARKGEPLAMPVLSIASPGAFYGGDTILHYTVAWLAFHFAMHGDDGAHRDAFIAWLRDKERDPDGFLAAMGMEPAAFEAALAGHAARLSVD